MKFSYYDPHVSEINSKHHNLKKKSLKNYLANLSKYELIVILTDHDVINYKVLQEKSKAIIDTRGVYAFKKFQNVLSL